MSDWVWAIVILAIIILIAFTRIMINEYTYSGYDWRFPDYAIPKEFSNKKAKLIIAILNIAVGLSIAAIGFSEAAITVGCTLGYESDTSILIETIILDALLGFIMYVVIGMYRLPINIIKGIIFGIVFVVSFTAWGIYLYQYYHNFETTTKTVVTSKEERQLIYFCGVPVQRVRGKVFPPSEEISTTDELPYWYVEENGEAKYDSAEADASKIVFISEGKNPYVEIVTYQTQTKRVNLNNGKGYTIINRRWVEYTFHLPEEIKQHSLSLSLS